MIKKGIILAFIAQLAVTGFASTAKAKTCTKCTLNADGVTYTCENCV